ncbi:MAG TPA: Gmad2 immunoglobulin-like domain-containing protein [Actinomycetota bacterium]|nr:Gmad2 immunoglobulin-like domain-containing protein [Actinomycetota bacterium]
MLRARSPRIALGIVLVLALTGAACDDGDDEPAAASTAPSESPVESPTAAPPATPTPATVTQPVRLWLTLEDFTGLTTRQAQVTPPRVATAAVTELLKGPTQSEISNGWGTAIPAGSQLLGIEVSGGVATVDLSGEFESGGGSLSARMRLAQLVYTLTEFQTVQRVKLEIDGQPATTFSSEGIVIDGPMTRGEFEDLIAPIVVETPIAGQRVSSPVRISGTANVFEATVSMRILGPDNEVIAEDFATATCGTGCRGDYSKNVAFDVVQETQGIVQVFESSAKDGSPLHVVSVPVVLVP